MIPAAGRGDRIGLPKLFLRIGEETFLERIVLTLREAGVERIVAIVASATVKEAQALLPELSFVVNPTPERGMLSSVALGLAELSPCDGILVFPVDHPFVQVETCRRLMAAFREDTRTAVKPVCEGRGGHPILLPGGLVPDDPALPGGLAEFLQRSEIPMRSLPVDDPGILRNINLPVDLEELHEWPNGIKS